MDTVIHCSHSDEVPTHVFPVYLPMCCVSLPTKDTGRWSEAFRGRRGGGGGGREGGGMGVNKENMPRFKGCCVHCTVEQELNL